MAALLTLLTVAAPEMRWTTDLDAALRDARAGDKLVLVYVLDTV